jgi:hypothetical protein
MIEHVIADVLLNDPKVKAYCGGDVHALSSPDGTRCPYIVITETDDPVGDDVVNEFDITVEIYDYDKDKRKVIALSQHIKKILHRAEDLKDPNGLYSNIRLYYQGRNHTKESDSTLSMMLISFKARATEEELEDEDVNDN